MATLTEQLKKFKISFDKSVPVEVLETLSRSISLIQRQQVLSKRLIVGNAVHIGALYDSEANLIDVDDLLLQNPLIITFIRGAWCPYCMLELQHWNEFLKSRNEQVNFVAISAETSDLSELAKADNKLDFTMLVDKEYQLSRKFGLTYEIDSEMKALLLKWGVDLTKRTCIDDYLLPIPATYIIDKNNEIRYAFIEEDYTQRAEPSKVYNEYKKLIR